MGFSVLAPKVSNKEQRFCCEKTGERPHRRSEAGIVAAICIGCRGKLRPGDVKVKVTLPNESQLRIRSQYCGPQS